MARRARQGSRVSPFKWEGRQPCCSPHSSPRGGANGPCARPPRPPTQRQVQPSLCALRGWEAGGYSQWKSLIFIPGVTVGAADTRWASMAVHAACFPSLVILSHRGIAGWACQRNERRTSTDRRTALVGANWPKPAVGLLLHCLEGVWRRWPHCGGSAVSISVPRVPCPAQIGRVGCAPGWRFGPVSSPIGGVSTWQRGTVQVALYPPFTLGAP